MWLQSKGFLVQWKGLPKWQCTLEPRRHLNAQCLAEFSNPTKPTQSRLDAVTDKLLYELQKKLSNPKKCNGLVRVEFELDIFRWVFHEVGTKIDGGWLLCEECDFERLNLPAGWFERDNKLGGSVAIQFPLRVKGVVRRQRASRFFVNGFPQEYLYIFFCSQWSHFVVGNGKRHRRRCPRDLRVKSSQSNTEQPYDKKSAPRKRIAE